jgi:SAM-dependent methyltransferase
MAQLPDRIQLRHYRHIIDQFRRLPALLFGSASIECTLCSYRGRFLSFGVHPREGALCPNCRSLERHRLLALMDKQHGLFEVGSLLHFAPEEIFRSKLKARIPDYRTTDLCMPGVDFHCNMEHIDLPDASYQAVLASHILEHVDDRRAMPELHRILKPGGRLIAMVPQVTGWDETYEDPAITSEADRTVHFGRYDHVRYYGRDFASRLRDAGFTVREYLATPAQCLKHGLTRGERVFVAIKAD